jgi:hypothetical protein
MEKAAEPPVQARLSMSAGPGRRAHLAHWEIHCQKTQNSGNYDCCESCGCYGYCVSDDQRSGPARQNSASYFRTSTPSRTIPRRPLDLPPRKSGSKYSGKEPQPECRRQRPSEQAYATFSFVFPAGCKGMARRSGLRPREIQLVVVDVKKPPHSLCSTHSRH